MALIGMFHYRKDPEKVTRAYTYASIAKMEGVDFVFFSSKCVDMEKQIILGYSFENGAWVKKEFPLPDVIMNVVGPITEKQVNIYSQLKQKIPFTSFPVGNKLSVYKRILKGSLFKDYLIPFERVKRPLDVFNFLKIHPKVILKPIVGSHGKQVVYIEQKEDQFIFKSEGESNYLTRIELYDNLTKLLEKNKMLIQKFIYCKNISGDPYDFRLHLQKNGNGEWVNTLVYPKVGYKEKVATNLGQGGQITLLEHFLKREFGDEYFNIKRYLEVFALQFAKHFDSLYPHEFDEIGIDVGIDEHQKIWIYEVNWRPGHMFIESMAAKNAVSYACYLIKKLKGGNQIGVTES